MSAAVPDAPPPYDSIVFDCDSTLSSIEGIEELFGEPSEELQRLTDAAMNGELALEEVYGRRLELARPTRDAVQAVGERYVRTVLPNAHNLIEALQALGKQVAIVSGGLLPAVRRLGTHLGVAPEDVHAVDLEFDGAGAYAGFDTTSPLARRGGKLEVLRAIAPEGPVALVGDGATDLEAAEHCARFVAFGGVVRRDPVFSAARAASTERDFAALLPLLASPSEIARLCDLRRHADLVDAARPWL